MHVDVRYLKPAIMLWLSSTILLFTWWSPQPETWQSIVGGAGIGLAARDFWDLMFGAEIGHRIGRTNMH